MQSNGKRCAMRFIVNRFNQDVRESLLINQRFTREKREIFRFIRPGHAFLLDRILSGLRPLSSYTVL